MIYMIWESDFDTSCQAKERTEMKKIIKRLIIFTMAFIMLQSPVTEVQAATKYSMKNVLNYYKKRKYTTAQKIANKLPAKANEKAVKNMSSKVKKAYLKKLKTYGTKNKKNSYGRYMQSYYFTDIDKDGVPELLVQYGAYEADMELHVYTWKNGKVKCIKKFHNNHTTYYAYPNGNGFILCYTFMGYESISKLTLKNGKLHATTIGGRWLYKNGKSLGEYMKLPYLLEGRKII